MSDGGIQFVCSSWAKKMIVLRLKTGGMGLFNNLFICIIILLVLCYYRLDGAFFTVFGLKFGGFVIAKFHKFRGISDSGWF